MPTRSTWRRRQVRIDGGERGAVAWVTTAAGLHAVTDAGERIDPPWAQ